MKKKGIYEHACLRHLYLVCHAGGPVFRPVSVSFDSEKGDAIFYFQISLRLFDFMAIVYPAIMSQILMD